MNIQTVRWPTDIPTTNEPRDSTPSGPPTTDRARQAAARYDAFASGGDQTSPHCASTNDPAHDYDACGSAAVDSPRLFARQNGDPSEIDMHDVQQASVGDCYFMATLSALAQSSEGRALIRGAITENRNDRGDVVTYTVTLHKPEKHWLGLGRTTFTEVHVTVEPLFANGHAAARPAGKSNEVWPIVMEKAYAQFSGGYNAIAHGGLPSDAMQVLTGREARHTELGWLHSYPARDLQSDLAAGNLVVLGTRSDVQGYGLLGGHSYVATGTYEQGGRLYTTLHNPWDSSEPQAVPVDEIGLLFHAVNVGSVR
jgi:hypothetical protein